MGNFYLDLETTGLDPAKEKIITIQFLEIDRNTAAKKGELRVLKEWESSERDVLLQFSRNPRSQIHIHSLSCL